MSKFIFKTTPIEGPIIIKPSSEGQSRDYLTTAHEQEQGALFEEAGIDEKFVYPVSERLARGVIRGFHFARKETFGQLVGVTSGRILAVVVDLRPESKSFGAAHSVELTEQNETTLYVPPYFALGFMTLEPKSEVVCNAAREYSPEEISGIVWDDEILAIEWQFERYEIDRRYLNISLRDKKNPSFRSYNQNTLWINRPKKSKYALSQNRTRPNILG